MTSPAIDRQIMNGPSGQAVIVWIVYSAIMKKPSRLISDGRGGI